MKQLGHLTQYDITLETMSPLFIGAGKKISKKMYYRNPKDGRIYILDEGKLARYLLQKGLMDDYEKFMLDERSQKGFADFAGKYRIGPQEIRAMAQYHLQNTHDKLKDVHTCVKTAQHQPYVPGSSLKGALRTALLVQLITELSAEDRAAWCARIAREIDRATSTKDTKQARKNLEKIREDVALEEDLLHTLAVTKEQDDALNSAMRAIAIADSAPLSPECLMVATKNDYSVEGKTRNTGHALFRESLEIGTRIQTTMTIDTELLARAGMRADMLTRAIDTFASLQKKVFYSKFKMTEVGSKDGPRDRILYLGGGVGFVNKTVLYALDEQKAIGWINSILKAQFPKPQNGKGGYREKQTIAPYMRKMTLVERNGNKYPTPYDMGKCRINVQ